jgi:cell wall-associated NlpC family hydrolase
MISRLARVSLVVAATALVAACGSLSPPPAPATHAASPVNAAEARGQDVALFAMGLVETGYRFGGKNPEAGLDCSGMVSYVYGNAAGLKLVGSAADIARKGRPVGLAQLKPGDLVFFNTQHRPHSHVGIYIGDGRFVHAPKTGGKVRTEDLKTGWFAERFEEARSYFD